MTAIGRGPVLVTGGSGWIGSVLLERLSRDHPETIVVAPTREELDCADALAVVDAMTEIGPRAVVHLAGSLQRGRDSASERSQWRDTFAAGRSVIEASALAGVRHVVIAGTMDELGDQSGVLDADTSPRPLTTYGLCKMLVRQVAAFEARRHPELRVDWFRPTTVYGPGQRGSMLIPYACAAAVRGEDATFTDGTQQRDFLFVDDLVDWLLLALDARVGQEGERGVHDHPLGRGEAVAVKSVLDLIAAEFPEVRFHLGGLPPPTNEPVIQAVPPYHDPDPRLGEWKPSTTLAHGIRRTVRWWQQERHQAELQGP